MFQAGAEVDVVDCGGVIGTFRVVSSQPSEVEIEDGQGNRTTFAHKAEYHGWKMLFLGLGGERCFSQRAPTYEIKLKQ